MKKLIALLLLSTSLTYPPTPYAQTRPWTTDEKIAGTALGLALLADWSSTRYAARQGWTTARENNPFLGSTPSPERVDLHFLISIPLLYWTIDQLDKTRPLLLWGMTGIEIAAAKTNLHVGLKFQF
jgi:hypothetical protein